MVDISSRIHTWLFPVIHFDFPQIVIILNNYWNHNRGITLQFHSPGTKQTEKQKSFLNTQNMEIRRVERGVRKRCSPCVHTRCQTTGPDLWQTCPSRHLTLHISEDTCVDVCQTERQRIRTATSFCKTKVKFCFERNPFRLRWLKVKRY